jgi:hypothetical protein
MILLAVTYYGMNYLFKINKSLNVIYVEELVSHIYCVNLDDIVNFNIKILPKSVGAFGIDVEVKFWFSLWSDSILMIEKIASYED